MLLIATSLIFYEVPYLTLKKGWGLYWVMVGTVAVLRHLLLAASYYIRFKI